MSYGACLCEAGLGAHLYISSCPHFTETQILHLCAESFESFRGGCSQLEACLTGIKRCQRFHAGWKLISVSFLSALDISMESSQSRGKASSLWMISLAELGYWLLPFSVGGSFKCLVVSYSNTLSGKDSEKLKFPVCFESMKFTETADFVLTDSIHMWMFSVQLNICEQFGKQAITFCRCEISHL